MTYPVLLDHVGNLLDGSVLVIVSEVVQDAERGNFASLPGLELGEAA